MRVCAYKRSESNISVDSSHIKINMESKFILLTFFLLTYNGAIISPMEVILERAEIENSTYVEGRYNFSRCRITRFNRTKYVFETEFELMVDLNSDYSFELSYHYNRLSNNQYTRMPFQLPQMSVCLLFELYYKPYMMENVKNISNFPQYESNEPACPFKKVFFFILILNNQYNNVVNVFNDN